MRQRRRLIRPRSAPAFESLEGRLPCAVVSGQIPGETPIAPALGGGALLTITAAPKAVTALSAARGDQQVTLTWKPPANTGGSPIQDYVIQYRSRAGGTWSTWQTVSRGESSVAQAVVGGLVNGRPHLFRVAAVTSIATGPFTTLSAPVTPAGLPQAPTALTATRQTAAAVLRWSAPVDTGGLPPLNYAIQMRKEAGGSWGAWATVPRAASTATGATITGLDSGSSYEFKVSAVNAVGAGAATAAAGAMPTFFLPGLATPAAWVRRVGTYASYSVPSALWQAAESAAGVSVSSATGTIGVNFSRGTTDFSSPRQALDHVLQSAVGVVSYQVVREGTVVSDGVYTRQEFEVTGVSGGYNGLMYVRGALQVETYRDPGTGAAGYSHFSMLARTDLWAGSLGTMQRIRSSISWIAPPA
jgi:hypothetical protein